MSCLRVPKTSVWKYLVNIWNGMYHTKTEIKFKKKKKFYDVVMSRWNALRAPTREKTVNSPSLRGIFWKSTLHVNVASNIHNRRALRAAGWTSNASYIFFCSFVKQKILKNVCVTKATELNKLTIWYWENSMFVSWYFYKSGFLNNVSCLWFLCNVGEHFPWHANEYTCFERSCVQNYTHQGDGTGKYFMPKMFDKSESY